MFCLTIAFINECLAMYSVRGLWSFAIDLSHHCPAKILEHCVSRFEVPTLLVAAEEALEFGGPVWP